MKNLVRFLAVYMLIWTHTSSPLIVEFLKELHALTEFNAIMRSVFYEAVKEEWNNAGKNPEERRSNVAKRSEKTEEAKTYTFANLGGDIPEDVKEIVEFIGESERFAKVGANMPRGILLYGPPGTGKTSIARAIAGEAQAEFFSASGSDFVEVYVGVGPQRVRELFEKARKCKKAIIFIDEIDAIGGKRSGEQNAEYRNTLNALLKEMDGFEKSNNIFVIAATNRVEDLDEALLRPGRFDRKVKIDLPSMTSRSNIFKLYISAISYFGSDDIYAELARNSEGLSGAEIKNVVNEAAVLAARDQSDEVTREHLTKALNKTVKSKRIQQR